MLHSYEFHAKLIMNHEYVMRFRPLQGVCWSVAGRSGFLFQHTVSRAALGTLGTFSHLSKAYRGLSPVEGDLGYYQSQNRRIPRLSHE